MNRSESISDLAAALCKAQGSMEFAPKDSENPFFKSRYADLAAIWSVARKALLDNGLAVTQHPSADGNIVTVETVLCHATGQWLSSVLTMLAKDASPQSIGSCITYIRRYSLSSVLGIASEDDDDGNSAQPAKGFHPERKAAPGRAASSPPPSTPTPPVATPPAGSEGPTKAAKELLKVATANTRAAALSRLEATEEGPVRNFLHRYLVALGWLENEKVVEQWPCRFVPITAEELEALRVGLASFSSNGVAVRPYAPHGLDPNTLPSKPVTPPAAPPEPELPTAPRAPTWRDYTVAFGARTKGKTLGSFAAEDLQGFIENFTVKEFSEDAQGVKQPFSTQLIADQQALRAALNEAAKELAKQPNK